MCVFYSHALPNFTGTGRFVSKNIFIVTEILDFTKAVVIVEQITF
jgi:hypothetical protein